MRPYLILALTLLLLLGQAAIVGLGMFAPKVSENYRAVFIEHSRKNWTAPNPS
jgi:hypothetical protein